MDTKLDFLKQRTLFFRANQKIADAPPATIETLYQDAVAKENWQEARFCAQKLSILQGLKGLYLYIPLQLAILKQNKEDPANIISQDLLKVLSLIYYIEQHLASASPDLEWIATQKQACLALASDETELSELEKDAQRLCSTYP